MTRISKKLRAEVKRRAKGLCEYCQLAQLVVVEMEIDHIIPISLDGKNSLDNLCYSCGGCNGFKHDAITGYDSLTQENISLYNPRKDIWSENFSWSEDFLTLQGLTPVGRATVEQLQMNREVIIKSRKLWKKVGVHPSSLILLE